MLCSKESFRLAFLPKKDTYDVLSIGLSIDDDGAADTAPAAAVAQVRCWRGPRVLTAMAFVYGQMCSCTWVASARTSVFICTV